MAKILGVSPQTVLNEIKRGTVRTKQKVNSKVKYKEEYSPVYDQCVYETNRMNSRNKSKFNKVKEFIEYAEKMILRNGISEKTIDLVNEDRILRMNEMRLRIFFDAIRKQNNKFVLNHLATEENKKKLNENDEKEAKNDNGKYYGPKYSEVIANSSDDIAVNLIDVNAQDQTGYTPIIVAIESGNNEILKVLVENGANLYEKHPVFGKLTLHTACYYENEEAVEILLKADRRLVNAHSGNDGWLPLQDATLKSNARIVEILLKYGANPLLTDARGGTPMDMATEFGKGVIVKLLRDNIKKNRK